MRTMIFLLLLFAPVADADHHFGRQVRFVGIHPIPKSDGGGMCNIEGPHVHIYATNKLEYRDHHGDAYFVGDPAAYKFEGPKYAYNGPHPIHVDAVVGGEPDTVYCYLEGPHFHNFQPPAGADFKLEGDAYFYVAEPPQVFIDARPAFVGINTVYRPLAYSRPVVSVEPPHGWIGARAEFAPPRVEGGVIVDHRGRVEGGGGGIGGGISIGVAVPPPPSISIGVGVGVGVGVSGGAGGPHHGRHH